MFKSKDKEYVLPIVVTMKPLLRQFYISGIISIRYT